MKPRGKAAPVLKDYQLTTAAQESRAKAIREERTARKEQQDKRSVASVPPGRFDEDAAIHRGPRDELDGRTSSHRPMLRRTHTPDATWKPVWLPNAAAPLTATIGEGAALTPRTRSDMVATRRREQLLECERALNAAIFPNERQPSLREQRPLRKPIAGPAHGLEHVHRSSVRQRDAMERSGEERSASINNRRMGKTLSPRNFAATSLLPPQDREMRPRLGRRVLSSGCLIDESAAGYHRARTPSDRRARSGSPRNTATDGGEMRSLFPLDGVWATGPPPALFSSPRGGVLASDRNISNKDGAAAHRIIRLSLSPPRPSSAERKKDKARRSQLVASDAASRSASNTSSHCSSTVGAFKGSTKRRLYTPQDTLRSSMAWF